MSSSRREFHGHRKAIVGEILILEKSTRGSHLTIFEISFPGGGMSRHCNASTYLNYQHTIFIISID